MIFFVPKSFCTNNDTLRRANLSPNAKKGDFFAFEDEKKPRRRLCLRGKWWL